MAHGVNYQIFAKFVHLLKKKPAV